MHAEERNELVDCADCGATIEPAADRAYAISSESHLCFDCAVRRGGVYDSDEDRWTAAPDVSNLGRRPESTSAWGS